MRSSIAFRVGLPLVVVGLLSSGCGSSSTSADGSNGSTNNTPCSIVLTGALSATYPCGGGALADYVTSTKLSGFSVQYTAPANSTTIASALGIVYFTGVPTAGTTYTSASAGAASNISVTLNGNAWFENFGNGGAAVGAYTLTITSVTSPISTAAGTEYTVHGSLSATLPPRSENTNNATITLSATF